MNLGPREGIDGEAGEDKKSRSDGGELYKVLQANGQ